MIQQRLLWADTRTAEVKPDAGQFGTLCVSVVDQTQSDDMGFVKVEAGTARVPFFESLSPGNCDR